jgi:nitrate/nitrite-specific signal transduction histidine kinase
MTGEDTLPERRDGLRLLSIVAPLAGLAVLYPVRLALLLVVSPLFADLIVGFLMCAGVVAFSVLIFRIIINQDHALAQQFAELKRRFAVERRLRAQLEALHESSLNAASADSPDAILDHLVDLARELVGARQGLLGVLSHEGELGAYYAASQSSADGTSQGLQAEEVDALRMLLRDDVAQSMDVPAPATRRISFPPGYGVLRSVIGVPMTHGGLAVGALYLADKSGASEFSADDERLLTMLANQAAIVVQNARLKEQVRLLAIAAERERIQKDLHDGMLQSIFAVNLELEGAAEDIMNDPAVAQTRIDLAIDRLNDVMEHIRNYIIGLRATPTESTMDMNQEVQHV